MPRSTTQDSIESEIHVISHKAKACMPDFNENRFLKAFDFARNAHEGQLRKDGSPYIIHPVAAARILVDILPDEETLIACLLHDVPEDTQHSLEEIEELFGAKIAFLVDGITKLAKVHYQNNMEERQVQSLKKLLLHTAQDPRVIIIKLADRLHNMRTLQYVKPEKRLRIARETLEIYVPMANLLGIQEIKSELEDLCFQYLFPYEYEAFKKQNDESEERIEPVVEETLKEIGHEFSKHGLDAKIIPRKKTLYSIFSKLKSQNKGVSGVYDMVTLRILVKGIDECYQVLGIVHTLYKPKTGRFRDYIALPKINGYRSLHTTVFGVNGMLTEFQIRTYEMDRNAQFGITARIMETNIPEEDKRAFWIEQILSYNDAHKNTRDFISDLKADFFEDRICVFSPKGEPVYLPKGASGIDFIYGFNPDMALKAAKLEINGEEKPLTASLSNGDTVEILENDEGISPQYEWLNFAKTNIAKNGIRDFLRSDTQKDKLKRGREILQKAFDRAGLGLVGDISFKRIQKALERTIGMRFDSFSQLYIAIAENTIEPIEIISSLYPDQQLVKLEKKDFLASLWEAFFSKRGEGTQLVEMRVSGLDRAGLVKDIVTVLSNFSLNIVKLKGWHQTWGGQKGIVIVTLELEKFSMLNTICAHLEQIDGVEKVERIFFKKNVGFFIAGSIAILFWLFQPFLLRFIIHSSLRSNHLLVDIFFFVGVGLVLLLSFYIHILSIKYFPAFRQARAMWFTAVLLNIFALITVFSELVYYRNYFSGTMTAMSLGMVLLYLIFQFLQFRKLRQNENA